MNLAIMQPYFFPYIGYFSLFDAAEHFVVYDDVNYIKKGWINRNNFLSGEVAHRYTLPIVKASQNSKICDLRMHNPSESRAQFLKMLTNSYANAPFFDAVMNVTLDIFSYQTEMLADFLFNSLVKINTYLNIDCTLIRSSEAELGKGFKGEERIIEIAKELEAQNYINAVGGKSLYSPDNFKQNGLNLYFLEHQGTNYRQFGVNHTPFLSIIDVIMFNSPVQTLQMIKNYELRNG